MNAAFATLINKKELKIIQKSIQKISMDEQRVGQTDLRGVDLTKDQELEVKVKTFKFEQQINSNIND